MKKVFFKMLQFAGIGIRYIGITIGLWIWLWGGTLKVIIDFTAKLFKEEITIIYLLLLFLRWIGLSVGGAIIIYFSWLISEIVRYFTESKN